MNAPGGTKGAVCGGALGTEATAGNEDELAVGSAAVWASLRAGPGRGLEAARGVCEPILGDGRLHEELRGGATGGRFVNSGSEADCDAIEWLAQLWLAVLATERAEPMASSSACKAPCAGLPDQFNSGPRGLRDRKARRPTSAARVPRPFPLGGGRAGGRGPGSACGLCTSAIAVRELVTKSPTPAVLRL